MSLENCSFENDLQEFIEQNQTGTAIPEPLPFEPFRSNIVQNVNRMSLETFSDNNSDMQQSGASRMFQFQKTMDQSKKPALKNQKSFILDQSNLESTYLYDPFDLPSQSSVIFTVRVLYDYQATAREELSIKAGQLIPVTQTHEDGWWEGLAVEEGQQRKGLFPSNFCENV